MKIKIKNYVNNISKTISFLYITSPFNLLFIVLLNIFSGIMISIKIWIWKKIVDLIVSINGDLNAAFKTLAIYLILEFLIAYGIQLIADISQYIQIIYGEKVDRDINEIILNKIDELTLTEFECSENYNIIQKANEQTLGRSVGVLNTIVQLIKNISSSISIIVLIASFNSLIVIMCFITTIPLFILENIINQKMYFIYNRRYENIRFAHHLMQMCLKYENIKELKIFNAMRFLKKNILKVYDNNIREDKKERKRFTTITSEINFLDILITYAIKLFVIINALSKKITIGSIVVYAESIEVLKTSIKNSMSMIASTYDDSMYLENIFDLIKLGNKNAAKKNLISTISNIEFKNVYFKYLGTDKYSLINFSYFFTANKSYGLIGLNGAGKTTLVKLILGLYEVEKGEILINGININSIDPVIYRKLVSAIFQDFIRYPFDVKTNITLSDEADIFTNEEIENASEFSGCIEFISKLKNGYQTKLGKEWADGIELSLGQWQKLAVSRAVLKKADLLILDEPTSSLDALTEYKIFSNFNKKATWKITLLITHRLKNVKDMSEIIVLKEGKLKEHGSFKELMNRRGEFYTLYMLQEREEI